jgi:uncharacterized protein (DUF169 family)
MPTLNLKWPAVAVAFLDQPPAGVARIDHPLASGCAYWKRASEGSTFYTTPEDHFNCTVGAFTHGVSLPEEKQAELMSLVGTMVELKYLRSDEVPAIPRRASPMAVAAYAPLESAPFTPDVVVFRGNARQAMLVSEAARAAGIFDGSTTMGRPACAMIPQAMASASGTASLGCIGNRVYTGLADDEMYVAIPGSGLARTMEKLDEILTANAELEKFHQNRRDTIGV